MIGLCKLVNIKNIILIFIWFGIYIFSSSTQSTTIINAPADLTYYPESPPYPEFLKLEQALAAAKENILSSNSNTQRHVLTGKVFSSPASQCYVIPSFINDIPNHYCLELVRYIYNIADNKWDYEGLFYYSVKTSWSCTSKPSTYRAAWGDNYKSYVSCQSYWQLPKEINTCPVGANPILPGTGTKLHDQIDIPATNAPHGLELHRYYRSRSPFSTVGQTGNWHHAWQRQLLAITPEIATTLVYLDADGTLTTFTRPNASSLTWTASDGGQDSLTEQRTGSTVTSYQLKRFATDALETYSPSGQLLSVRERNGWTTTLSYSDTTTPSSIAPAPGLLMTVRNAFGRELRFRYDTNRRLTQVSRHDPAGTLSTQVRYSYDSTGRLTRLTWPDNTFRTYLYENTAFPNALTGITDELGVRLTTYAYDSQGRATRTEQAGGVNRVDVAYNGDGSTTVTDYAGTNNSATTRTYRFETVGGVIRPTSVTAPCPLCGSTQKATYYNAAGDIVRQQSHTGEWIYTKYDAKRRPIEVATFPANVSGSGGASRPALNLASQVISTQWHSTWNLPLKVAQPNQITTYTYAAANTAGFGAGNVASKTEVQTSDATGALAFAAPQAVNTAAQISAWAYGTATEGALANLPKTLSESSKAYGVTTAKLNRKTTLSYASSGARAGQLTNTSVTYPSTVPLPAAQNTSFTNYNSSGQVTAFQSWDGTNTASTTNTALTYNTRGYLTQYRLTPPGASAQTTTYSYDAAGQLKKATLPDNSWVGFTYDAARRLTKIADSQNNLESYTLDKLDNRTATQTAGDALVLRRRMVQALFPWIPTSRLPSSAALASAAGANPSNVGANAALGASASSGTHFFPMMGSPSSATAQALGPIALQAALPLPLPWAPLIPAVIPYGTNDSADPDENATQMESFKGNLWAEAQRQLLQRLAEMCMCRPQGGYTKPTLTLLSHAHIIGGGHTEKLTYRDKSYFYATEPVTQALVDEVVKKAGDPRPDGSREIYYVRDMGRVVGKSPAGDGTFAPRRDVTMVVEKNNCTRGLFKRAGNEVVTMYPGK